MIEERVQNNKLASKPYEDRSVGCPPSPNLSAMTEEERATRRDTVARLKELVKKAEKGDKKAVPAIRQILQQSPDLAWRLPDFARAAENVLIGELTATKGGEQHPITEEALRRQLAAMREEVAGEDPSPLEKLLAARVVATWMQVQIFDSFCASELGKAYTKQADYHQRYLDRAHRRHLSAIKTLAQIRIWVRSCRST